jgi:hypothetical protein
MSSGGPRVRASSKEGSQLQGSFSKLRCHQWFGVASIQHRFRIVLVRHGRLVVCVGLGKHSSSEGAWWEFDFPSVSSFYSDLNFS